MGFLTLGTSGLLGVREQGYKISWMKCRIPAWPFDGIVKAERLARQRISQGTFGGFWVLEVADLAARRWPGSARVWHTRV